MQSLISGRANPSQDKSFIHGVGSGVLLLLLVFLQSFFPYILINKALFNECLCHQMRFFESHNLNIMETGF
jgi:hypothetical protein